MVKNNDKIFKNLEKYMKAIHFWPKEGLNFTMLFAFKAMTPVAVSFLPIIFGLSGHIYKSISEKKLSDLVIDAFFLTDFMIFSMCGAFYFYCGNKLLKTRKEFVSHKYGIPKNFEKLNVKLDKITTVLYYYTVSLSCGFLPIWCLWETDCLCKKDSHGQIIRGYMRGLISPAWFPFDLDIFPRKLLIFFCNQVGWIFFAPSFGTMVILLYGFVMLTVNKIEHLTDIMKWIDFMDINKELSRQKLRVCMKYYSEIVLLSNDVNDIVGMIFAPTQNGPIALIIGLLEYEIVLERSVMAFSFLMYFMISQAVACYSGQILEDASERFKEHVYDLNWYEMDSSVQRDFKLLHAFVQKTLHLKIEPNIHLNMAYYYAVMKGAYSLMMYFTKF